MNQTKESQTTRKHAERIAATPLSHNFTNFAFYGSLRPGQYNFERLGMKGNDKVKVGREAILPGYKMYSMGQFPFVVNTGVQTDTITVDLVIVEDELVSRMTHMMEIGAGYAAEEVMIDDIPYVVYVYPNRNYEAMKYEVVKNGDWAAYKADEQKRIHEQREKVKLQFSFISF